MLADPTSRDALWIPADPKLKKNHESHKPNVRNILESP